MSLERLAKRLKNGDEKAFDELYYKTKDSVYYMILSILHDSNLSQDIMQDTYIKIYNSIENYKSKNIKAYIVTIARNLAINEYNRRKNIDIVDSSSQDVFTSEDNNGLPDIINDLRRHLNERDTQIVILHVVYGFKHKEIAEMFEMPIGTILSIYSKSIKLLKEKWED